MTLTTWANIAAILLIIEALILALPPLIVLYLGLRGLRALKGKLSHEWFPVAHKYANQTKHTTRQVSTTLTKLPIQVMSATAGVRTGVRSLLGGNGQQASA